MASQKLARPGRKCLPGAFAPANQEVIIELVDGAPTEEMVSARERFWKMVFAELLPAEESSLKAKRKSDGVSRVGSCSLTEPSSLRNSKKSRSFEQRYISVAELAMRWSVSRSSIYHGQCGSDALTPIRFGRAVRFLRSEVEAFEKAALNTASR